MLKLSMLKNLEWKNILENKKKMKTRLNYSKGHLVYIDSYFMYVRKL